MLMTGRRDYVLLEKPLACSIYRAYCLVFYGSLYAPVGYNVRVVPFLLVFLFCVAMSPYLSIW